jgi:hypothetical protein
MKIARFILVVISPVLLISVVPLLMVHFGAPIPNKVIAVVIYNVIACQLITTGLYYLTKPDEGK